MAQDHFDRHNHHAGAIDWNFNVTFAGIPSVAAMAAAYHPLLTRPEFYDPIPAKWLHATILRVGSADDYRESEMLALAGLVQERVSAIRLPKFTFSRPRSMFGSITFSVLPESELEKLYTAVTESLEQVVGPARATKSAYGHFIAHTSFAYSKARDNEAETDAMLASTDIPAAVFRIKHMPLIRQWPIDGHYEWEVVRDITLE